MEVQVCIIVVIEPSPFVSLLHIVVYSAGVSAEICLSESMERPKKRPRSVDFFLNAGEQPSSAGNVGITVDEEANERWPMYLVTHYNTATEMRKKPKFIENANKKVYGTQISHINQSMRDP